MLTGLAKIPTPRASSTASTFTPVWTYTSSTISARWVADSYKNMTWFVYASYTIAEDSVLTNLTVCASPSLRTFALIWCYTSPTIQAGWVTNSCVHNTIRFVDSITLICLAPSAHCGPVHPLGHEQTLGATHWPPFSQAGLHSAVQR